MTTVIIDLSPETYQRLRMTAQQQQKPIEVLAREWLEARTNETGTRTERDRALAALRAAGLVRETVLASEPLLSEHERAALAAHVGAQYPDAPTLSSLIIAERDGL